MLDRLCAVAQEFVEEKQHFFHICEQILFRLRKAAAFDRRGNTVAHENQKGLFNPEFPQCIRLHLKQLHLLIEGQQAAYQIQMLLFRVHATLQIIDAVVLAVSVAVEILVGIIHNDGFPVFLHQRPCVSGLLGIAGGIGF